MAERSACLTETARTESPSRKPRRYSPIPWRCATDAVDATRRNPYAARITEEGIVVQIGGPSEETSRGRPSLLQVQMGE